MTAGLTDALYRNRKLIRFHTPGHSGKISKKLIDLDVTELPYSDNLLDAGGLIKETEAELSELYGVRRALISANGATNCILTALYSRKGTGGFLILGEAHSSVCNAALLADAETVYSDTLPAAGEAKLKNIKTVIVTSPSYLGTVKDLKAVRAFCDEAAAVLIVDASHGSHFIFSDKFPVPASVYGDLVIHSLHKTLPVPTGGAVLLVNKEELIASCLYARRLFHSTSPSYIVLTGISDFTAAAHSLRDAYERVFKAVEAFGKKLKGFKLENTDDRTRVVVTSKYEGKAVYTALLEKGFALETFMDTAVVAVVTPYNYQKLSALAPAFNSLSGLIENGGTLSAPQVTKAGREMSAGIPDAGEVNTYKDPEGKQGFELIPLTEAAGRRLYYPVGFYPPGVPLVNAGEIITGEQIKLLTNSPRKVFGLEDGRAFVVL